MLQKTYENLWEHHEPMRAGGVVLGRRMTVVRLADGGIWIHAPTSCTPEARRAVEALGPVRWIVAPSRMHTNFIGDWASAYPDADFLGTSGVEKDFPEWRLTGSLAGTPPDAWNGAFLMHLVGGMPKVNEIVFFHKPSGTLIVADLLFNLPRQSGWWPRMVLGVAGTNGRLACSRLFRSLIRDRKAFARSMEIILRWNFRRVILGHGDIVEDDARARLQEVLGG